MNDYQEQLNRPWVRVGIAFVVGAIFGLVVLGWWLFPVQWTDASRQSICGLTCRKTTCEWRSTCTPSGLTRRLPNSGWMN